MADDALRALLAAALERLRKELLANPAIQGHTPSRAIVLRTLDEMRDKLDSDPEWVEQALREMQRWRRDG